MTEGDGVAFPLMPDRERVEKVALRLSWIQLHDVRLSRCRANGDDIGIFLGPVESCVVGKLVAYQELSIVDLGP